MGEAHCICKEKPCRCNNGWGFFETETQLMAAISGEIASYGRQIREEQSHPDAQAVHWMEGEGMDDDEIAEALELSAAEVRRILYYEGV